MRILVTRPKIQSVQTAQSLKAMGHEVVIEPLLTIDSEPESNPKMEGNSAFGAIIVTSTNACPGLDEFWPSRKRETVPVLTTGESTRTALLDLGFTNTTSVNGSALKLSESVQSWLESEQLEIDVPILYPCAQSIAHDLETILARKGINCTAWPVYRAIPASNFTETVIEKLTEGHIDAALVYSTRTAKTFVSLLKKHDIPAGELNTYVLSKQIFDSLPGLMKKNCHYPDQPNEAALFKLINQ